MSIIVYLNDGRPQIDKVGAFCEILNNELPNKNISISSLLEDFDRSVRDVDSSISTGALSNCHGDWYEWLLAIEAWNYHVKNPNSPILIHLPNITQFDVMRLYNDELYSMILDLRQKVEMTRSIQLITSNPDFVIIDPSEIKDIPIDITEEITRVDEEIIQRIINMYRVFISKCDFTNIIGYFSVKTTFRPDRRLQMPHEGSLMKALYTHLQTRKWILSPKGLKYYAAATSVNDRDRNALRTVATHSITTVHNIPEAAVDEVFEINSLKQARAIFKRIL